MTTLIADDFSAHSVFDSQKSWTPLMVAALAGYADVVEYLVVQKNADFRRMNLVYAQVSSVHI